MNVDEFGLIRRLTARVPVAGGSVDVGPGDDAAVLRHGGGERTVITTDTMVGGRHFLPQTMTPYDIGWKAAAASISDIAAMGGEPQHMLIALGIPKDTDTLYLDNLYDGIGDISKRFDIAVVGGDVVSTDGPLFINTTVLGTLPENAALLRSGAQTGHVVFVSGTVGTAQAGLLDLLEPGALPEDDRRVVRRAHQLPVPQVEVGAILLEEGASSCNDISDGLASELCEISAASGVRLRIEERKIPIAPAARNVARLRGDDALEYAWFGGEDYQLVGTASPFQFARILARCESIGLPIHQIGRVELGDGVVAETVQGELKVMAPKGYNHFG